MNLPGPVRYSCAVLCAAGALATPASAQQPPAPPEVLAGEARTAPSFIWTTITVPMAVVGRALEEAVPKRGSGTVADPIKGPVVNDTLGWNFSRSALQTKGVGGAISISSSISGTTTLKGVGRIPSEIKRFIGGGLPDFPFSATTRISATTAAQARPELLPNWRVQPHLTLSAKVQQASVPIQHLGTIGIQGQVQSQIDAKLGELKGQLETKMRGDTRLETEARKAWTKLCQAHPLDVDRDGKPDLYLRVTPILARAAQPRIGENAIEQQVGIEARTEIGHDATKPDCPFPASVQLRPLDEPRFEVALPIELGFDRLNALIAPQLPKTFESPEYWLKAEIRKVTIAAAGADRLSIAVEGTLAETRSGTTQPVPGTFLVRATPRLEVEQQRIVLEKVELDPKSLEVFGVTGEPAQGAARLLERGMSGLAADLKPEAAKLPGLADAAVRALNQAKGAEVVVTARFEPPKLATLDFDERRLRLTAQARGKVTVAVRTSKVE